MYIHQLILIGIKIYEISNKNMLAFNRMTRLDLIQIINVDFPLTISPIRRLEAFADYFLLSNKIKLIF